MPRRSDTWFDSPARVPAGRRSRRARALARGSGAPLSASHTLETLERRLVMAFDPSTVPALSALEDPTNPVALFETTLGNVYIELFVDDAPTYVANFINYMEAGRWADSIFHRRSSQGSSGLSVLQGGGFYYTDAGGLAQVQGFAAVPDEANPVREHDIRTISMAKAGANTATSQFFINLEDNSDLQFLKDQKFTVFGRVVGDASWSVVQALAAVPTRDLRNDPNISPSSFSGAFGETSTRDTYSLADGFNAEDGLYVVAATLIKLENASNFFEHRQVFPAGYRGPGVSTIIELGNTNDFAVVYQVILRYRNGADRDQVITTGTVNANTASQFRLFDASSGTNPAVKSRNPFSIEVWSTPRDGGSTGDSIGTPNGEPFLPLVSSIRHSDFNGHVSEQFYNATNIGTREQQWILPRVEVDALNKEAFVNFQNLSDKPTVVTIQVLGETGVTQTLTRSLGALRRRGLQVSRLDLTDGVYAFRLTADQPIVAAVTQFARNGGQKPGGSDDGAAWNALGTSGFGGTRAYTSIARIPSNGSAFVDIAQLPGSVGSVVTLEAFLDNGTRILGGTTVIFTSFGGHRQVNLRNAFNSVDIPDDTAFTLRVSSSINVSAQTTFYFDDAVEAVASQVPTRIGNAAFFSNGFLPGGGGTGVDDLIAVFNPFRAAAGVNFRYQLEFRFNDGTTVTTGLQTLGPFARTTISLTGSSLLADVRAKIASNPTQFGRYTISVLGFDVSGSTPSAVPVLAQIQRIGDNTQVIQSNPLYFTGIVPFTNAQFS